MSPRWLAIAILVAIGVASCAPKLPPVAVIATRTDALALAGTWEGEYSSVETRRFGKIQFFLSADPDSAAGEVLMFPSRARASDGSGHMTPASEEPHHLSIRLVMAAGDSVMGVLSPYEDYDGSALLTRFAGVLNDDTMKGRYVTENLRTRAMTDGEWSMKRKRP